MRLVVPALLVLFAPTQASATAQIPDIIMIDGEKHSLFSNPLEQHFAKTGRPDILDGGVVSSANWRGYVATWAIEGGRLYLTKVEKEYAKERQPGAYEWLPISLLKLFPSSKGRVIADWYTGTLRVPRGEELQYVHMGYGSIYERELRITIRNGKVAEAKEIRRSLDAKTNVCTATVVELRSMTVGGGNDPEIGVSDPDELRELADLEEQCKLAK
jgi:hypothetical protein